jgi:PAS domain S-box-containing protein
MDRNNKKIESSQDYDDLLDQYSDGVVAIDCERTIISFSKGAERITGFKASDVQGKKCDEVFRSEICENNCIVKKIVESKSPLSNFREDIKNSKDETIPVSINGSPLFDTKGKVIGAVLVFRDILEVYTLTSELFKESSTRQSILNSIAEGVFTVDKEWRITSFNPSAERITGFKKRKILGRPCHEAFRSNFCGKNCPLKMTVKTGKSTMNFEMEIVNKANEKIPVSVSTALLKNERGETIGGVETFRDLSEIKKLTTQLKGRYSLGAIMGKNPKMQDLYNLIEVVSNTNSTVLILGETGTGKDLVAKAIHYNSPRRERPFIKVSCAALPESLLESEIFGHKRGAFTGAVNDKPGRFLRADGGTIFLDEIGEIPLSIQVKLLRVLEEKEFEPLGGTKPIRVDVRIIAATNRDLKEDISQGRFREDLFYRLNVVPIHIPPLRERKDDIPLLVDHFIKKFSNGAKKKICSISPHALRTLLDYSWPGNVRQLENVMEYASVHCEGKTIQSLHLPVDIKPKQERGKILERENPLDEVEKELLVNTLKKNNGDREKTAHALQISRTTLWRKMKKYDLIPR